MATSINRALAMADAIHHKLNTGIHDPANRATTPEEILEGQKQKEKAQVSLRNSITVVDEILKALCEAAPKSIAATDAIGPPQSTPAAKQPHTPGTAAPRLTSAANIANTPAQRVVDDMSADSMKPSVKNLQHTATAVGPIIEKFDSLLANPYLSNYRLLTTVPVVGLKGDQIMYVETQHQETPTGNGPTDIWSVFSSLPTDAKINPGDVVHMFPYKDDFCLSIGRAVWKKIHCEPRISAAVDNRLGLYSKDWVKVGDNVLPAVDLRGVIPFAMSGADCRQIAFQLVVLHSDGRLQFLSSNTLGASPNWDALTYNAASGGAATSPKFDQIAYWNNQIVGVDGDSKSYSITPSFQMGTYSVADPVKIEPITELTASDASPIALRGDGYLYKRIVEAGPDGKDDDPTPKWIRWIKADGVTRIGVASPDVLLDMNLLIRTLRSRYIDMQATVYPVIDKIRAFGTTHAFFRQSLQKDALAWQNASTNEGRAIALKSARSFINHAKTWATIVGRSMGGVKESVNLMMRQLHGVRAQLETQLTLVKDKLTGLQAMMTAQGEVTSDLKVEFWWVIVDDLLGLVLLVVGVATVQEWLVVGVGYLLAKGIKAASVLSSQRSDPAANSEAQISDISTAISEISEIVTAFTNLAELYVSLNTFWNRLQNDVGATAAMDGATVAEIGQDILRDTGGMGSALKVTQNMTAACQTYLEILNKQGIQIPMAAIPGA